VQDSFIEKSKIMKIIVLFMIDNLFIIIINVIYSIIHYYSNNNKKKIIIINYDLKCSCQSITNYTCITNNYGNWVANFCMFLHSATWKKMSDRPVIFSLFFTLLSFLPPSFRLAKNQALIHRPASIYWRDDNNMVDY